MTTLAILLGAALAVAVGGNVAQAVFYRLLSKAYTSELKANSTERLEADKLADTYKEQRDEWAGKCAVHVKRIGELESLLRDASSARDAATKETIRLKAERIRNAPDATTAAGELGSVFSVPIVPDLSKASDSGAGNGRGGSG